MRSRLARFLLIFAALWLPLQAVAGIAMEMGRAAGQSQPTETMAEHCSFHEATPDTIDTTANDDGCNSCGICHLAATGYVPAAEIRSGALPVARSFHAETAHPVPSRDPEPPQHPPKRSA